MGNRKLWIMRRKPSLTGVGIAEHPPYRMRLDFYLEHIEVVPRRTIALKTIVLGALFLYFMKRRLYMRNPILLNVPEEFFYRKASYSHASSWRWEAVPRSD